MKIAHVAPVWSSIPPQKYGGTELVVSSLTEELVNRGHEVTLFATTSSKTSARHVSFIQQGILESGGTFGDFTSHLYHILRVIAYQDNFDIYHFHFTGDADYITLALTQRLNNVLFTAHIPFPISVDDATENGVKSKLLEEQFCHTPFISISDNQRAGKKMNFIGTVYNGIEVERFPFSEKAEREDIFYLGRISRLKGTAEAIEVAKSLKQKLIIAGKANLANKYVRTYVEEKVKPLLASYSGVESVDELNFAQKINYYLRSKLFLFPIQWEEPFGLVMIEAMATGTPVVAFARGSVPEVVKDGETGYIVNATDSDIRGDWIIKKTGIEGLIAAVEEIYALDEKQYRKMRHAARRHVEENFTASKMVDGYEQAYMRMLR